MNSAWHLLWPTWFKFCPPTGVSVQMSSLLCREMPTNVILHPFGELTKLCIWLCVLNTTIYIAEKSKPKLQSAEVFPLKKNVSPETRNEFALVRRIFMGSPLPPCPYLSKSLSPTVPQIFRLLETVDSIKNTTKTETWRWATTAMCFTPLALLRKTLRGVTSFSRWPCDHPIAFRLM